MNRHHAFVIEAEAEKGIAIAHAWAEKELGLKLENNPDINVLRYGLFSVADARRVTELVAGAAFEGESKVLIITADRAYHEAQNALLKVFEEPPAGTHLFLVIPSLGGLLPTLRSRVQILTADVRSSRSNIPEVVMEFLRGTKEIRSALIKKLTSGKDEEKRRENREDAIALVNGIEATAYAAMRGNEVRQTYIISTLLSDIATLRSHLYDRSAPVKMILEHLSLILPKGLS